MNKDKKWIKEDVKNFNLFSLMQTQKRTYQDICMEVQNK